MVQITRGNVMEPVLQQTLTSLQRRMRQLYGHRLVNLVLYGSQARGDAEPGSDIDVMVILQGDVHPCTEIARTEGVVARTSLENDQVVSCSFVSERQFHRENTPLLINARREGIPL